MTRKASFRAGFTLAGIASSVLVGLLLLVHCGGDTGNPRIAFEATMAGTPAAKSFVNERGYTIELTRAQMTVGPVYLNVQRPLTASASPQATPQTAHPLPRFLAPLVAPFAIKSAWAHGESHLATGRVVGEVLSQVTFDALSDAPIRFPTAGNLTQEPVRSLDLWFYPEPGVSFESEKIDTVALDVAGVATKGAERVAFRGKLQLNDAWLPEQETRGAVSIAQVRTARGVPAEFVPTEGGSLRIVVDVRAFFRGADFSALANNPKDADGTRILVQAKSGRYVTDQVMTNLYQGIKVVNGPYRISWVP
jgi:hypothetical protein